MSNSAPSMDDLNSLNHEIASLVRAGVPLELGLRGLSGGVSSRLAKLSDRLAIRLSDGWTLPDALVEEGDAVSPVYTAVIKAGLASGRLPEALESLAVSGDVIQEIRRRVFLAVLYPLICAVFGYWLFIQFLETVAPRMLDGLETFPHSWAIDFLRFLYEKRVYFTRVVPAVSFTAFISIFILRNGVARSFWHSLTSFHWVIGRSLDQAQFSELLALQIDHGAQLPAALVLAADSTENTRLHREARIVAEELTRGNKLPDALKSARSLPPLVRWMLASGEKQGTLALTLRQMADLYRRKAIQRAAVIRIWLPIVMTIVFTSTIGATYGLAFFLPLRAFLLSLMQE